MICHSCRIVSCALCLLLYVLIAPPASASENKEWRTAKARYARFMRHDPAFAESEKNFAAAKQQFLARFGDQIRPLAERMLLSDFTWDMAALLGKKAEYFPWARNPEETTGKALAESRQNILRYMKLVQETPYEDPAFSLLLLPVAHALTVPQGQPNDLPLLVWEVLAVYDMYRQDKTALPAYGSRTVAGRKWLFLPEPEGELARRAGGDVLPLGFVVRNLGRDISIHPVLAPDLESFYPSLPKEQAYDGAMLRPAGSKRGQGAQTGPRQEEIHDGRLGAVCRISNTEGPFSFVMEAKNTREQRGWNSRRHALTWALTPECSSFPYTWNESGQGYMRGVPECKSKGEWGAYSPFRGETLLPVEEAFTAFTTPGSTLQARRKEFDAVKDAYLALFEPETRKGVNAQLQGWLYDRQFPLLAHTGNAADFTKAFIAQNQSVLDYMRLVLELAKTPDARLLFLLDPVHARMTPPAPVTKEQLRQKAWDRRSFFEHDFSPEAEREYRRSLPDDGALAAYAGRLQSRLRFLLEIPDGETPEAPGARMLGALMASHETLSGIKGGGTIRHSYFRMDGSRVSYRKTPTVNILFTLQQGDDGAYWGLSSADEDYSYGPNSSVNLRIRRITRIANGRIAFLPLAAPAETAFFKNGAVRWPGMDAALEALAQDKGVTQDWKRTGYPTPCPMLPAFEVDASVTPFKVTAKDMQIPFEDWQRYTCTPECSIPYVWNGSAYAPGTPDCLPEGRWGVATGEAPERFRSSLPEVPAKKTRP